MSKKINFEESLKSLEAAVAKLESGELSLDEALKVFAEGVEHSRCCRTSLQDVELQVEQLLKNEDGQLQREQFDES